MHKSKNTKPQLIREMAGGEPYEYYALGKHIVSAPGICGGRPTFKHTRLEVSTILSLMASGYSIEHVVSEYKRSHLTSLAVREAIELADKALIDSAQLFQAAG